SVEKGRSFEDQVADLYRLLGARVTQNIEIHQKKVDILATFRIPGSSREHTVIVECKNEQRSVAANQRIMAFKGLLDVARKDGIADSAEIVTRVPGAIKPRVSRKPLVSNCSLTRKRSHNSSI